MASIVPEDERFGKEVRFWDEWDCVNLMLWKILGK
jgi:hypothetical protein